MSNLLNTCYTYIIDPATKNWVYISFSQTDQEVINIRNKHFPDHLIQDSSNFRLISLFKELYSDQVSNLLGNTNTYTIPVIKKIIDE
jgi:hypothetical protein